VEALAKLATRRPVAVTVLGVTVALLGWIAADQLPVDLLPDIHSPTVVVSVRSGDRPPVEMERLYGEQVEQRLFTVRGIREVTQVARTGRLVASVVFEWDADMDLALVDVQKAIGPVAADPEVDEVLVRRFDPRQEPVLTLGLLAPSGQPDLAELRRIAERQVGPGLERLAGVAEVRVLGGREKELQVLLDPQTLEAHGITLAEIEGRLQAANVDIDAGTLEEGDKVYLVRGLSRFRRLEDVENVVVRHEVDTRGRPAPIRISDLAEVTWRDREIDHLVLVDGEEGVGLSVYKEAGANTVSVSRTLRESVAALEQDLPSVRVQIVRDEAALVEDAIADLEQAAAMGILLAVVVLALFLRSPGPTVVVASAVPVSLLSALFFMRLSDQSLNVVTLAGLALGAGMLVDNAIVVVESIHRRLAEGDPPDRAAAQGASEVGGAIAASTLTTCVVFVPVLFVSGLAARLIEGIAFAVIVSLSASLAVAVLLIPALSGWLLRGAAPGREGGDGLSAPADRLEGLVLRLTEHPGKVVGASVLVAAGSFLWLGALGTELLPPADPAQFSLRLVGPPGRRVEATAATVAMAETVLREAAGAGLEAVQSEVGRVPEDDRLITTELTEENTARILLRLAQGTTSSQVVARAAPALDALPETQIEWEVGTSALARIVSSGPPIVVEISGQSTEDLRLGADRVFAHLRERPELWNVDSSFEGGPPELRVVLDRALADGLGVDLETVTRVLEAALDGRRATLLTLGDEERRVVLRLRAPRRDQLDSLRFTTPAGARLALGQVAHLVPSEGAREIFRRDQRRVARVTARLAEGVAYPAGVSAARAALGEADLPPGLRARLAGEEEERQETVSQLGWAAALAVILVLMVLAGTFESLLHPWTVLAAIPLSAVGVAALLGPLGNPVGVMAMLGLIVLAGIAVNDAILLVAAAQHVQAGGIEPRAAVARAAALRLRPILMTTLTTAVALLPLALGTSEAARLRSPMALVIIGGILASMVASLLVIPCLYVLLERLRRP
jgi:HAE1 family hydrophobic/amphiphilic exporter-1